MLGLLSLPKLTSSSGDEWMTSSRVGHSLTDGGHVLQDMKEAMKVACQTTFYSALYSSRMHLSRIRGFSG